MMKKSLLRAGIAITVLTVLMMQAHVTQAVDTAPHTLVYNGHLLDSSGNPVTTAHQVRFSFWDSRDFVSADITATGAINIGASTYANWNEEHTVTPNAQGYFSVELGSITSLPGIETYPINTLLSLFLQVEVKTNGTADTAYELMDIDASDTADDRSPVLSVPFALNAEFLDQREIGTSSGDIVLLEEEDVFPIEHIPGGTASGVFVIDFDNTEVSEISLQFGNAISRALNFDIAGDYFEFENDVRIEGNLTVTGLINGIDITQLVGEGAPLRVTSGAGLNVSVGGGSYRIAGNTVNYGGTAGISINDDTTNYIFFTATGLTVNEIGFPTNRSFIPLAEVTTAGGTISSVADRRVLQSDDRERIIEYVLHPLFEGAGYQGDGSDNVGRMYVDHDTSSQRNFYHWTSSLSSLQDYDILVRVRLPDNFTIWEDPSLNLTYRSSVASNLDNQVDIAVFDTAGAAVTLSGSTADLASTSWTSTNVEFTGSPTFTAGEDILVRLRVSARNDNQINVGGLQLNFRELNVAS